MGYFIGPGDGYGGDYSLYKGTDPTESHSIATLRIINGDKPKVTHSEFEFNFIFC